MAFWGWAHMVTRHDGNSAGARRFVVHGPIEIRTVCSKFQKTTEIDGKNRAFG